MPRIHYRNYNPKAETRRIIEQADAILLEYEAQGFQLTLRQLYYQFIARDAFPESYANEHGTKNSLSSYNKLKGLVGKARESGMLDWSHITDRGRERETRPQWDDPRDFLEVVAPQFAIDRWEGQPQRVEVWVEKDALSQVLERACRPLDVPYMACKGYISASAIWEAAHSRFRRWWNTAGQSTVVIHLSDHDPSGIDMERDINERLQLFSSQLNERDQRRHGHPEITVDRIALTMEQIREYEPPPNPAKEEDSRFRQYEELYGNLSWELDALEPAAIVEMVQERIRGYMDDEAYAAKVEQEREWRNSLRHIAANYDSVVEHLPEMEDDADDEED